MGRRRWGVWTAVLTLVAGTAASGTPTAVQGQESRADEIRLAMSAGPVTVSREADVWVMGPDGFEKAVEGTNGWACLVVRSADQPGMRAPHCLNPAAARTVLPAFLLEGRLQAEGKDQAAIQEEWRKRWEAGTLPLPEDRAMAYMMSSGQRLGPNLGRFQPHAMLYVPYATNESIGGDPGNMAFPFVGPYQGHPLSTVVFVMREFVDPEDVVLPER